eukprot:c23719_g1_i4 orf=730-1023(+)
MLTTVPFLVVLYIFPFALAFLTLPWKGISAAAWKASLKQITSWNSLHRSIQNYMHLNVLTNMAAATGSVCTHTHHKKNEDKTEERGNGRREKWAGDR